MYYTVKTGDTLYDIARRYHTTVEQLQAWNGIRDPNFIKIGQRLIVKKDKVKPGDSDDIPFPGAAWFKTLPESPIIHEMGIRLMQEGCSAYGHTGPSYQWNAEHRNSYAMWQRKLNFKGSDADGWPGETSWNKLHVPYPSEIFA